jgi:hypothetical protein
MKAIPVFTKSLGLNDMRGGTAARVNYDTGECELQECFGVSVSSDGALVLANGAVVTNITFDSAVVSISYSSRLVVHAGTGLYVVNNWDTPQPTAVKIATVVAATIPVVHTNLDFRYCDGSNVFVVLNGSNVAVAAAAGVYPGPVTTVTYSAMPAFDGGFVYNGILYVWKGEFVLHSMPWAYDCWNIANDFLWLGGTILNGVAGTDAIVFTKASEVVTLVGSSTQDFVYVVSSVEYVTNSLAVASRVTADRCFYLLGLDGVYEVSSGSEWKARNVTIDKVESSFWLTATGAVAQSTIYHVQGVPYSIDFDIASAGVYKIPAEEAVPVCAVGTQVVTSYGTSIAVFGKVPNEAVITFPKLDFAIPNLKRLQALTISGVMVGDLTVSVQTESGSIISSMASFTGLVDSYKFKEFKLLKGNSFTVTFVFDGEYFMLSKVFAYVTALAGV